MMQDEQLRELWDSSANGYAEFTERFQTHKRITLLLLGSLTSSKRILDFGCGPGNSTRLVKQVLPSSDVVGLDTAARMVDIARELDSGAEYVAEDLRDHARVRSRTYDAVLCSNSFFHVFDKTALVAAMRDVLVDEGRIVFSLYDSVFRPREHSALPFAQVSQPDAFMEALLRELHKEGYPVVERGEDRQILSEESLAELFNPFGFTLRATGAIKLRRTTPERSAFFRIPVVAAEVFPQIPPESVARAVDRASAVVADQSVERIVYGFEATLSDQ